MLSSRKRISVVFYKNYSGKEPVRDFLSEFNKHDKKIIGTDIVIIEFGWPIGMPVCKAIGNGLYEVRSTVSSKREVRILFFILGSEMYLLHGFIKKSKKTPIKEIELAVTRMKEVVNASKSKK
jgi:phage-related protein